MTHPHIHKVLPKNAVGRDFIIGDLHGSYTLLMQALAHVGFDKSVDRLCSVGDLVDRGPENEKCLRLLNEPWFHAVKGNHEVIMNDYYTDGPWGSVWGRNGGNWGLTYRREPFDPGPEILKLSARTVDLPLMLTVEGEFHIIHAELYTNEKITEAMIADEAVLKSLMMVQTINGDHVIWGRKIFESLYMRDLTPTVIRKHARAAVLHKFDIFGDDMLQVYSGHTIVQRPVQYKKQLNLDTGSFLCSWGDNHEWAGLTLCEHATGKLWLSRPEGVREVERVLLNAPNPTSDLDLVDGTL